MDYTLNIVSKCRFFIFKQSQALNRSWKIIHGGPGKVLEFVVSKRAGTLRGVVVSGVGLINEVNQHLALLVLR